MNIWEWILLAVIHIYCVGFPYTKVEESFGIQSIHDILYHIFDFEKYDHKEFPGVVPRTFLGSLTVAGIASPFIVFMNAFEVKKRYSQYLVRIILGTLVWISLLRYKRAVDKVWGNRVTTFFLLITLSQFHFLFYSSRTLPNIFALILVLQSLASFLSQKMSQFICFAGLAILLFRSELCIFFGPYLLLALFYKHISISRAIIIAVPAAVFIIGFTVLVDSLFWGRLLWPELDVFWFNTILNRSSEYGSTPLHWYFTSALPRSLLTSIFLIPIALVKDSRARLFTLPALVFVALYSLLPHKELRFIIYGIPIFNTAAAVGFSKCMNSKGNRYHWSRVFALLCWLHLVMNVAGSLVMSSAALYNYPGGSAIAQLHDLVPPQNKVSVHICNLAAQTGVTRFLQENPNWRYNKTEGLETATDILSREFSHLIIDMHPAVVGDRFSNYNSLDPYKNSHHVIALVPGFGGLSRKFPFIRFENKIAILQKK